MFAMTKWSRTSGVSGFIEMKDMSDMPPAEAVRFSSTSCVIEEDAVKFALLPVVAMEPKF